MTDPPDRGRPVPSEVAIMPGFVVSLEAVLNVRDLGGTATPAGDAIRPGCLLRGASVSTATAHDVQVLRDVGVADVVDLRADWERAATGPVPAAFTEHHLPLVDDGDRDRSHQVLRNGGLVGYYTWLVSHAGARLVEVVEVVAGAQDGVLIQCGAGKDRTGVAIAVLLGLLAVPDATIVADYAATGPFLSAIGASLARTPGYGRSLDNVPREALGAPPEAMASTLRRLHDVGGVAVALTGHGLTSDHVTRLRDRLLQPVA